MRMQKYKKLFTLLFLVTIFLAHGQAALALEANYPQITIFGNTYRLTSSTSITQLIEYLFVFLIAICGFIAVMSIVISGVKILVTAGSPGAIGEAKERILGAVLGIVLLFSSVLLLQTINPQIVNVRHSVQDLPGGTVWYAGVMASNHPDFNEDDCYWNGSDCWVYIQAPESEANTANIGSIYTNLFYSCVGVSNPKRLLVWKYSDTNFRIDRSINGSANMMTEVLGCGEYTIINTSPFGQVQSQIKSFKRSYENPGVYFYLKPDCAGIASEVYTMSSDILPFDDQANANQDVRSMRIVSGRDSRQIYGVILSRDYNLEGTCSAPVFNEQQNSLSYPLGGCFNTQGAELNFPGLPLWTVDYQPPKYMYLLNFDKNYALRTGGGVKLYSKDYVAELKQKNPATGNPPVCPFPIRPGLCEIGRGLWLTYPIDPILRLKPSIPPSADNPPDHGIGTRWTPKPYPNNTEEDFAKGKPVGSLFYNAFLSVISLGQASPVGSQQCDTADVECIEKIEHNGTYYTILYSKNPRTVDRACTVLTGSRELNTIRLLTNGRVLEAISITPTTP